MSTVYSGFRRLVQSRCAGLPAVGSCY